MQEDSERFASMLTGTMTLPEMVGKEISPGIFLVSEPKPVPGTNVFRALADVKGMLCTIELNLKFIEK